MPDFKDMLTYFRMREGLSKKELAERLGLSASTISMYEAGKREPDFETEELIADFFNTDLDILRGRASKDVYYLNNRTSEAAQFLFDNPEYQVLFDASKKVKPEDIAFIADFIERLSSK